MLEKLKEQVMEVAKLAQRDGLCKHKSGNFSARDPESGLIVITPTGVDREKMVLQDMVVMNMDAEVVESINGLKPTSEAMMHLAIYRTREDVHAIVHTHSKFATVFAVLNKPIPAVVYEMFHLGNADEIIPVAPYGRPGTMALAESVIEPVKHHDAFLLQAHGDVAVDETSIEEAYLKACYVEEIAELYEHLLLLNRGKEPEVLPSAELQKWGYPSEIHLLKTK